MPCTATSGVTRIEAEDQILLGSASISADRVGFIGNPGDGVRFWVYSDGLAPTVPITIWYTRDGTDNGRTLTAVVNGAEYSSIIFPPTGGDWNAPTLAVEVGLPMPVGGAAWHQVDLLMAGIDLGQVDLDAIEFYTDGCSTPNRAVSIEDLGDHRVAKADDPSYELLFTVDDLDPGDVVTVEAAGLPSTMDVTQVSGDTWKLSGDAGAFGEWHRVTLVATDNTGEDRRIASTQFWLTTDDFGPSALQDDLIVTEVLFEDTTADVLLNEAIEIRNIGTQPIDLAAEGIRLADYNVVLNAGWDLLYTNVLDYTIPGTDVYGNAAVLQPGERALLTSGHPSDYTVSGWTAELGSYSYTLDERPISTAALHFALNPPGTPLGDREKLNEIGDDIWVLDGDVNIVDYVAWGDNTDGTITNTPFWAHDVWDTTWQLSLRSVLNAQSISLASTNQAIGGDYSGCWEATGSGDATARGGCPTGTATTVRDEPANSVFVTGSAGSGWVPIGSVLRGTISSLGQANIP